MNILYIKVKAGYAEGARPPRHKMNKKENLVCVKLRKNEKLVA